MSNNCAEVDELILKIADYKNDYADMAAEKLFRKCSTSWEAYQYLRARGTMPGYPTAHVSSCDELSEEYKCKSISVASTATHTSSRERDFGSCEQISAISSRSSQKNDVRLNPFLLREMTDNGRRSNVF